MGGGQLAAGFATLAAEVSAMGFTSEYPFAPPSPPAPLSPDGSHGGGGGEGGGGGGSGASGGGGGGSGFPVAVAAALSLVAAAAVAWFARFAWLAGRGASGGGGGWGIRGGSLGTSGGGAGGGLLFMNLVGLLNTSLMQLTHSLKGAWFQPLSRRLVSTLEPVKCEKLVSKVKNRFQRFAFQMGQLVAATAWRRAWSWRTWTASTRTRRLLHRARAPRSRWWGPVMFVVDRRVLKVSRFFYNLERP
jgi:hypothetical protein